MSEGSAPGPPTIWKPSQIAGSTACTAIAATATVRIWAMIITQPVNQPKVVPAIRLRPLEDRAGDRPARGELGEVQGDEQLAGEHQRPGPEERGAAEAEAEPEELEHGGEDGDEREAGRERREGADTAVQFLTVDLVVLRWSGVDR